MRELVMASRSARSLVFLAFALAGCASAPQPVAEPTVSPPAEIVRVESLRFAAPVVAAVSLEVRGPRAADLKSVEALRELTRRMTDGSVALSGVAAAEAFLLPGFLSGSLVAGGLILAPLAIGLDSTERRQHETIVAVLKQTDLLALTRESLAKRLPAPAAHTTLSVIVLAYGLVPKYGQPNGPLCLTLDAELTLRAGERELFRDTVHLEAWRRSADAPPPVCATLEAFAARDGAALHNAALDYAQILAAIVRHRTPALPWEQ